MRLDELLKRGDGDYIIAYKEYLWTFSERMNTPLSDLDERIYDEMKEILSHFHIEIEEDMDYTDVVDMIRETQHSVLFIIGNVVGNSLYISGEDNYRHSTASKTLLKVMDELNLSTVVVSSYLVSEEGDEIISEFRHAKEELLEPLENKSFFHGTNMKYALSIIKKGLIPKPEQTNYRNIKHHDKVFVTLNPERSQFHAYTAANEKESVPVILKLKIPDVTKLVLDYDVAVELYGREHYQTMKLDYDDVHSIATNGDSWHPELTDLVPKDDLAQVQDKSSLNTKLGVFGYKGRIPATMIEEIWTSEDNIQLYVLEDEYGMSIERTSVVYDKFDRYTVEEFKEKIIEIREEVAENFDDDED